ncbi:MAG: hypothetical protein ACTSRA_09350, partial [Promethearchaeota archaeon]
LQEFGIGAVVVKKHLVAPVDPEIINLGVYPDYFVRDLRNDSRFKNVFENDGVVIFEVPHRLSFKRNDSQTHLDLSEGQGKRLKDRGAHS